MIFLGAGASAPFNMPTSTELTQKLDDLLSDGYPDLLEKISTNLENRGREHHYENILKLLYVVTNSTLVPRNDWTQSFPKDYGVKGDYSNIIDKMSDIIYDDLTSPLNRNSNKFLTHEKIEKIFNLTYDMLIGVPLLHNRTDQIFTTNYDPSLEFWCQKRNVPYLDGTYQQENPDFRIYKDNSTFLKDISRAFFTESERDELRVVLVPIIRLHGSLLRYTSPSGDIFKFNRLKDELAYPDLYKDFEQKPELVLPGMEHLAQRGHWDAFNRSYEDNLRGDCLFIGYSFNHDEINDRIKYNLDNKDITRLGVFAPEPEENLARLFENENIPDGIVRIKGKFGSKKGMDEFIDKWWSTTFSSRDIFYDAVTEWLRRKNQIFSRPYSVLDIQKRGVISLSSSKSSDKVAVDPQRASIGDTVKVYSDSHTAGEVVQIYFDFVRSESLLSEGIAGNDGVSEQIVTIPLTEIGTHYFLVKDLATGLVERANIQII